MKTVLGSSKFERGFLGGSVVENPLASSGHLGSIPGSGRSHSNILAWRISWTEGPDGPQSMGLPRVRHDGATKQEQQQI